jgi:hypothetical protein
VFGRQDVVGARMVQREMFQHHLHLEESSMKPPLGPYSIVIEQKIAVLQGNH